MFLYGITLLGIDGIRYFAEFCKVVIMRFIFVGQRFLRMMVDSISMDGIGTCWVNGVVFGVVV